MPIVLDIMLQPEIRLGVWQITETENHLLSLISLNSEDAQRHHEMKNENRRKQWLACRILLTRFHGHSSLNINYQEYGKPYFTDTSELVFSVSHSGPYAAIILAKNRLVGIDIEKITPRLLKVKDRFLSEAESEAFYPEANLEKLSVYWCGKEALYKVYGIPEVDIKNDIIIHSFDYICIKTGVCKATLNKPGRPKIFTLWYMKLDDYMLAFTYD